MHVNISLSCSVLMAVFSRNSNLALPAPFSLNHFDPFDLFAGTLISWTNLMCTLHFFSLRYNSLIRFLRSGQVFKDAL